MTEKINISDVIKHMPVNRKLYSMAHGVVTFKGISEDGTYIICESEPYGDRIRFRPDGKLYEDGECLLYPDKMSNGWEEWPKYLVCRGDVLCSQANHMKSIYVVENIDAERNNILFYCHTSYGKVFYDNDDLMGYNIASITLRFASHDEKIELINAAKEKGYTLNFNHIESKNSFIVKDKIKDYPHAKLKPFDKVLTRCSSGQKWNVDFFGYREDNVFFTMASNGPLSIYNIIPYNDETKDLIGTTNIPPQKYIMDIL